MPCLNPTDTGLHLPVFGKRWHWLFGGLSCLLKGCENCSGISAAIVNKYLPKGRPLGPSTQFTSPSEVAASSGRSRPLPPWTVGNSSQAIPLTTKENLEVFASCTACITGGLSASRPTPALLLTHCFYLPPPKSSYTNYYGVRVLSLPTQDHYLQH